jgi:hypothetical protein
MLCRMLIGTLVQVTKSNSVIYPIVAIQSNISTNAGNYLFSINQSQSRVPFHLTQNGRSQNGGKSNGMSSRPEQNTNKKLSKLPPVISTADFSSSSQLVKERSRSSGGLDPPRTPFTRSNESDLRDGNALLALV